jgi:hypothetical protein
MACPLRVKAGIQSNQAKDAEAATSRSTARLVRKDLTSALDSSPQADAGKVNCTFSHSVEYHSPMQIASGTIVGGKVVVEGLSLPDGTPVTVLARGDEVAVRLPLQQEAELLDALDEADREEGISAEELFARLRRFG